MKNPFKREPKRNPTAETIAVVGQDIVRSLSNAQLVPRTIELKHTVEYAKRPRPRRVWVVLTDPMGMRMQGDPSDISNGQYYTTLRMPNGHMYQKTWHIDGREPTFEPVHEIRVEFDYE